jgi:hypothetical protein
MFSLSPNPTTQPDAAGVDTATEEEGEPEQPEEQPLEEEPIDTEEVDKQVGQEASAGGDKPVEKEDSAETRPRGRDLLGAQT